MGTSKNLMLLWPMMAIGCCAPAYAQNYADLWGTIPCSKMADIFQHSNPGTFQRKPFIESFTDILPADAWNQQVLNAFEARALRCFQSNPMLSFVMKANLPGMEASFQKSMSERAQAEDEKRQNAKQEVITNQLKAQEASNKLRQDLSKAEASSDANSLRGAIDTISRDLNDSDLPSSDRETFAAKIPGLRSRLTALIDKEAAEFDKQDAERQASAKSEEAQIHKLEELNKKKEAASAAERDRQRRLEIAGNNSSSLDQQEKDPVKKPNDDKLEETGTRLIEYFRTNHPDLFKCSSIRGHSSEIEALRLDLDRVGAESKLKQATSFIAKKRLCEFTSKLIELITLFKDDATDCISNENENLGVDPNDLQQRILTTSSNASFYGCGS